MWKIPCSYGLCDAKQLKRVVAWREGYRINMGWLEVSVSRNSEFEKLLIPGWTTEQNECFRRWWQQALGISWRVLSYQFRMKEKRSAGGFGNEAWFCCKTSMSLIHTGTGLKRLWMCLYVHRYAAMYITLFKSNRLISGNTSWALTREFDQSKKLHSEQAEFSYCLHGILNSVRREDGCWHEAGMG